MSTIKEKSSSCYRDRDERKDDLKNQQDPGVIKASKVSNFHLIREAQALLLKNKLLGN